MDSLNFQGHRIPIHFFNGQPHFRCVELGRAIGYKNSIPVFRHDNPIKDAHGDNYLPSESIRQVLNRATGPRRDTAMALAETILTECPIQPTVRSTKNHRHLLEIELDELCAQEAGHRAEMHRAQKAMRLAQIQIDEKLEELRRLIESEEGTANA